MSGVKHTPGKWLAAAKPSSVVGWPVVAAPMGQVICDVAIINKKPDHISDGEFSAYYAQVEANARLIASAPDLLEALIHARSVLQMMTDPEAIQSSTVINVYAQAIEAERKAGKTIARARGEQDGGGE